jgi:hypothetical protein
MERIPLDAIDIDDRTFAVSFPLSDSRLLDSVAAVGIIQPVILLAGPPYRIVCGFRRVLAARALGLSDVPAIVISVSDKKALLLALHDNLSRGLNRVEEAQALERMVRLGFTDGEIGETVRLTGIDAPSGLQKTLLGLAASGESLKTFVVERNSSMKNIEYLMGFEPAERTIVLDLLARYNVTESLTREILEMLTLLKVRGLAIDYEELSTAPDSRELKSALKRRVAPVLTALEERLKALLKEARVPPGLTIRVDPFFEKEYIDILIRAGREEDVGPALEKVAALLRDGIIRSLFGLTAGQVH